MASKADKEVAGGKVKEFKGDVDAFKAELSAAKGLVIVDFNAEWCGPCKRIAPVLEELAGENPDILFLGVDVDENEDVTEHASVSAMPTFKAYKDGKEVDELVGANVDKLKKLLKDNQ